MANVYKVHVLLYCIIHASEFDVLLVGFYIALAQYRSYSTKEIFESAN